MPVVSYRARPLPTVRRSNLQRTLDCYHRIPEAESVEVVAEPEGVARLIVHWRPALLDQPGRVTEPIITEDA